MSSMQTNREKPILSEEHAAHQHPAVPSAAHASRLPKHASPNGSHDRQAVRILKAACANQALCAVALCLATALLMALSLKTGPYLEKENAEPARASHAASLSVSCAEFGEDVSSCAYAALSYVDANRPYSPTPAEIAALPTTPEATAFSVNPGTLAAPTLSDDDASAIAETRSYFDTRGYTCGYLLVSLDTGRGISGNCDALVYGASTFKGILGAYICEELIDGGSLSHGSVNSLMTSTLTASNNDTYRSLHNSYARSGIGLSAWVEAMGVSSENVCSRRFPTYSARESAALWVHIAQYLEEGGETAEWLASLYEQTNVSHLRAAVERGLENGTLTCGDSWRVMNKAGWISGSANSTSDAGIIEIDGKRYVMSIMTSAPDCSASREACTQLALALLQAMQ